MKTMFWRVYPSYLVIILLLSGGFSFYTVGIVNRFFESWVNDDLFARAHLVEKILHSYLVEPKIDFDAIGTVCQDVSQRTGNRITVMLSDGRVIADTESDAGKMENHLGRPEVQQALQSEDGFGIQNRFSKTIRAQMIYVARTVEYNGELAGIIRISVPMTNLQKTLNRAYIEMLAGGLLVAVLSALIGIGVSGRISKPLRDMRRGVRLLAEGDLSHQLSTTGTREIDALIKMINKMARELDERISIIKTQRNEQEAILTSMAEGVLAVDNKSNLIMMNRAAENLLGVSFNRTQGESLEAVVRNIELHNLVHKVLEGDEALVEGEITLWNYHKDKYMQVHAAALADNKGEKIGALVVLNDITRLRRLENVRKDFVSNVSHELKTPITSIKGFVETLLAGASENQQDARRFLEIISRQADRLHAITEDLLTLSELEAQGDKSELSFQHLSIREIIRAAVDLCELKLTHKGIQVEITCGEGLAGPVNAHLLEQALVNLIDNAVKYSEPHSMIEIKAEKVDDRELVITVHDHGCGIDQKHLPRLFERFYRVDKARSRELGGTGLGLSIVKHIVQVHKGRITVESKLEQGTTFSIYLPMNGEGISGGNGIA